MLAISAILLDSAKITTSVLRRMGMDPFVQVERGRVASAGSFFAGVSLEFVRDDDRASGDRPSDEARRLSLRSDPSPWALVRWGVCDHEDRVHDRRGREDL